MKKQLIVFLIILILVLTCAFDTVTDGAEQPISGEDYSASSPEQTTDQQLQPDNPDYVNPEGDNFVQQEPFEQPAEGDPSDQTLQEQTEGSGQTDAQPEPVSEPPAPSYEGINSDQLEILQSLYNEMTDAGRAYSGWFTDYTPCNNWQGISCEGGQVTSLAFEGVGYFTVFPSSILSLHDLKSLAFIDTLMRGPLPDSLFAELPKLVKLELRGNYLTGEIPSLPDAYSPLQELIISDNRDDENDSRKTQLLWLQEYAGVANFQLNEYDYPDIDLEPGLDGNIPENWSALSSLRKIDLSGNQLTGSVPEAFASLYSLTELDLSNNGESFIVADWVYDALAAAAQNYPTIILDGIQKPVSVVVPVEEPEPVSPDFPPIAEDPSQEITSDDPLQKSRVITDGQDQNQPETGSSEPQTGTETDGGLRTIPTEPQFIEPEPTQAPPTEIPSPIPTQAPPTEIPTAIPTQVPPTEVLYIAPTQVPPTEVPSVAPTQVPPTAQTIIIVVTATPVPQWYTATPQSYYPTRQPYIYPTATPYYPLYYSYPTATPYTYYNPNWVYPTATSAYSYDYNYVPQYQSPTQIPTILPTQDQAALLGFTYKLEAMTENNIPMTWRYTGMQEYSIVYLDASGNLYPAFAMEWKPASDVCNSSVCNASVSVPDELLQQGRFSLQLRVRDAAGKIYQSDPVEMEVSLPQPTPTPVPEQPKSLIGGFLEWLFGPIIRLFGGGK